MKKVRVVEIDKNYNVKSVEVEYREADDSFINEVCSKIFNYSYGIVLNPLKQGNLFQLYRSGSYVDGNNAEDEKYVLFNIDVDKNFITWKDLENNPNVLDVSEEQLQEILDRFTKIESERPIKKSMWKSEPHYVCKNCGESSLTRYTRCPFCHAKMENSN